MGHLFDLFFTPPPMPPIELPLPAWLVPGVLEAIGAAFKLAYRRGVCDGLVAGVLLTLLIRPSIRRRGQQGDRHDARTP
jgi:hypothetical protein